MFPACFVLFHVPQILNDLRLAHVALQLLDEDEHLLSGKERSYVSLDIGTGIDTSVRYLTDTAGTAKICKGFRRFCGVGIVSGINTGIIGIALFFFPL